MPRKNASRRAAIAAILREIASSIEDSAPAGRADRWGDEDYEYTEVRIPGRLATCLDLSISGSTVLIRAARKDASAAGEFTIIAAG
ncbi:hypothetical protein OJF2_79430 (plasmid) [Aquisphaera giovannonii]|uniref:Uncharacterized protein n=1 Tax=Aquisphaera giovannonii TaxID=406548 RepID=A0A5B9WFD5_9BACT|nr:hypothetical protein [Aquisphaera giovannonii]QEH39328.1 hypothetical protein OJF2_79430 [Aquisphaera giovannonii]